MAIKAVKDETAVPTATDMFGAKVKRHIEDVRNEAIKKLDDQIARLQQAKKTLVEEGESLTDFTLAYAMKAASVISWSDVVCESTDTLQKSLTQRVIEHVDRVEPTNQTAAEAS